MVGICSFRNSDVAHQHSCCRWHGLGHVGDNVSGPVKFHPSVLAAHAQFGGDLESMQKCFDWHDLQAEVSRLRTAMQGACDLLAERIYGNAARSPGHNARVVLEWAMKEGQPAPPSQGETP